MEDKGTKSNLLVEGPEWVAKNLLELKDGDQSDKGEPTSPNLNLALGKPIYDQTHVSEVRPVHVVAVKEKDDDDDDEENSRLLSWSVRNPEVPFAPTPSRD